MIVFVASFLLLALPQVPVAPQATGGSIGTLVGLKFTGLQRVNVPEGVRISNTPLILPNGKVAFHDLTDASVLVFGRSGPLLERLAPPGDDVIPKGGIARVKVFMAGPAGEFFLGLQSIGPSSSKYVRYRSGRQAELVDMRYQMLRKGPQGTWWGCWRDSDVLMLDAGLKPLQAAQFRPSTGLEERSRISAMGTSGSGALGVVQKIMGPDWNGKFTSDLFAVDVHGELIAAWQLPTQLAGVLDVEFDGRNALLALHGTRLWSVDMKTGKSGSVTLPVPGPKIELESLTFVDGGSQAWAVSKQFSKEPTIVRFEVVFGEFDDPIRLKKSSNAAAPKESE